MSAAAVSESIRKREEMEERAMNLRRSLRGKDRATDSYPQGSPTDPESDDIDLPFLPAGNRPKSIVIPDSPIRSRSSILPSSQHSQPGPSSDTMFSPQAPSSPRTGVPSATDGEWALNGCERKRYERDLVSIRDENLQLLAQIVARRVGKTIIFDNPFPSDDDFDQMFREQWRIAEEEVGFKQHRSKQTNRVVSATLCFVNSIHLNNVKSFGKAPVPSAATWSNVPSPPFPNGILLGTRHPKI
jgi:hypothetical protein